MQSNFWKKLKNRKRKFITAIAPMSGVTDEAFRQMFLKYGRPDVFWTEFVPVAGFLSKGKEHCLRNLSFVKKEKPIVAQIFGSNPLDFEKAAKLIVKLGFDGIDINMGCPDRDVEKKGGGAALINNPALAKEIIRATLRGAQGKQKNIPVSVKTRIGYKKNQIEEWISALLQENISALTVHLRTREEMYKVPAQWELAKEIVKLRDQYAPETIVLGNGDVKSLQEANKLVEETGLDGVMVGRGVLGNPWFFLAPRSPKGEVGSGYIPTIKQRLNAVIEHANIFEKINKEDKLKKGDLRRFETLKKHFHAYAKGFTGAKEVREQLMKVKNATETKKVINSFLKKIA